MGRVPAHIASQSDAGGHDFIKMFVGEEFRNVWGKYEKIFCLATAD